MPFPTSRVVLIGGDGQLLMKRSKKGEVICASPAQMCGYLEDAPATAAATTPGGAMRTGDLGWFDEGGKLYLAGRLKELIITGGLNVVPAEIEAVACRHPRVAVAAVVGVPHPDWGETPVVVAVATSGASLTAGELLDHCRRGLSPFTRPSAAAVVDALPVTGIGKSAKNIIREQIVDGKIQLLRAS
jgi:acyl-CoA synthetase (AMP-forming)/AMP-acid ligase II